MLESQTSSLGNKCHGRSVDMRPNFSLNTPANPYEEPATVSSVIVRYTCELITTDPVSITSTREVSLQSPDPLLVVEIIQVSPIDAPKSNSTKNSLLFW